MKKSILLALFILFGISADAQKPRYTIPSEYSFANEGHKNYAITIIECVNWLENTPLDQEAARRAKAVTFLDEWLEASTDVNVQLNDKIMVFSEKNPILTEAFKAGWARLVVKDPERGNDIVGCNLAGIVCAMNVYQLRGRKKDKEMEKLIKLMKNNELSKWVSEQLGA